MVTAMDLAGRAKVLARLFTAYAKAEGSASFARRQATAGQVRASLKIMTCR
jgi:hypothetical protein